MTTRSSFGGGTTDATIAAALAAATFVLCLPYLDLSMPTIRKAPLVKVTPADVLEDDTFLSTDEGTIVSNADRISRGQALYREVFDFKGPVGYLPFVIAFKATPATARAARLAMFAVVALWAAVMYAVARKMTSRKSLAAIVAFWVPFQVWPMWAYAYQDFTAQLFLALAVLTGIVAFDRHVGARAPSNWSNLWLALTGFNAVMALWTSLAQGLTGLVALLVAVAAVAGISSGFRRAIHAVTWFAIGAAVGTTGVLVWLASMSALADGLNAIFVFPFKHYMSANTAPYAFDADIYPQRWLQGPRWVRVAVTIMMQATRWAPAAALAATGIVLTWLSVRVIKARFNRRPLMGSHAPGQLARVLLPAALAATVVPVVLNRTRSDICHLAFVEGGCVLAILAVLAVLAMGTNPLIARIVRGLATAILSGVLLAAVGFFAHAWHVKPPGFVDLDTMGKRAWSTDLIAARTRSQDRIFMSPAGGWTYLFSRRDNATSFALLLQEDYSSEQWPVAARQIVERLPVLLLIPDADFAVLTSHQPILRRKYFGYSGNYMLDDRGAGPAFELPARWRFDRFKAETPGQRETSVIVDVRADGGKARLLARLEQSYDVRAAIHGDTFSVFDGGTSYVGHISPDAKTITGHVYRFGMPPDRLLGARLSP